MKKPLAPYIPEKNPDAPVDPQKALADRTRAAIESRTKDPTRQAAERAEVAATPPKAKTPSPPTAGSVTAEGTPPASAPSSSEKEGEPPASSEPTTPTDTKSADPSTPTAPKGPRYEVKAFKRWLEDNPEEGANLLKGIGALTQETEGGFIKLANKRRKVREELTGERAKLTAEVETREKAIKEQVTKAEEAVKAVSHVADMWEAAAKQGPDGQHAPDFDMVDEAFKTNMRGLTLDQYLRMRARRGIANPESARLKAENARLARELAAKTKGEESAPAGTKGAAASSPESSGAPTAAAPAVSKERIELLASDVPKSHGLRKFDGWQADLHAEMEKYHDDTTDEYSVDVEDVANSLLKKKRAELEPVEELEAPAPRKKAPPAPAKRPSTPSTRAPAAAAERAPSVPKLNTEAPEKFMSSMQDRERWALERASRRARGEQVD